MPFQSRNYGGSLILRRKRKRAHFSVAFHRKWAFPHGNNHFFCTGCSFGYFDRKTGSGLWRPLFIRACCRVLLYRSCGGIECSKLELTPWLAALVTQHNRCLTHRPILVVCPKASAMRFSGQLTRQFMFWVALIWLGLSGLIFSASLVEGMALKQANLGMKVLAWSSFLKTVEFSWLLLPSTGLLSALITGTIAARRGELTGFYSCGDGLQRLSKPGVLHL